MQDGPYPVMRSDTGRISAAMGLISSGLLQKLWWKERTGRRSGILSLIFPAGSDRLPRKKKKGFYLQTYGAAGPQTGPIAAESLCSCCLEAGRSRRLICVYLQVRRESPGGPGGWILHRFLKSGTAGADDVPPGDLSFPDHMEEIATEGDPFSRLIRLPDEAEKN